MKATRKGRFHTSYPGNKLSQVLNYIFFVANSRTPHNHPDCSISVSRSVFSDAANFFFACHPLPSPQPPACRDDLGHREILGVVDVQPFDAVDDGHVGLLPDAAPAAAPERARENEKCAGFYIDRLYGLRAGDVVQRIVERPAFEPGEGLYLLGAERRIVFPRPHVPQGVRHGLRADERRGGVRQHVEVGLDVGRETVVDLPPERRIAVEVGAAAQETHALGQVFADALREQMAR